MRIIFCNNGFSSKEVDYLYMEEFAAAKKLHFKTTLISFEALQKGNISLALKKIEKATQNELALYRGWMLRPEQYQIFYEALLDRNITLINSPAAYKHCHYLPESYDLIKSVTPKTSFKPLSGIFDINDFDDQLSIFEGAPIIVKDYVKSQKHYWDTACYVPNTGDKNHTSKIIERFLELQADDLNEGLVFRAFVELEQLTHHSESGMPLTKEFRIFILKGNVMATFQYWDEGDYSNVQPMLDRFKDIIPTIQSNFFTMDIAKTTTGEWIIVELGDGQVAGLADNADKLAFYERLKQSIE